MFKVWKLPISEYNHFASIDILHFTSNDDDDDDTFRSIFHKNDEFPFYVSCAYPLAEAV